MKSIHIITKDKKEITWVGLPQHSAQALERLKHQREEILNNIKQKKEDLEEAKKQVCFLFYYYVKL